MALRIGYLRGCKRQEDARNVGQEERGDDQDARGRRPRGRGGKRRKAVSRMQEEGGCKEGGARGEVFERMQEEDGAREEWL
jgi:hypothetical protein